MNCDLDLEGSNFNFGDYHMTFIGNNHTISNFNLNYDASKNGLKSDLIDDSKQSLYVSLFGFTKGAVIKDVTFTNVTIKINTILSTTYKIYIAPISVKMEETCLSNVTFMGSYETIRLPENFNKEDLIIVLNESYYSMDDSSVCDNTNTNITDISK